MSLKLIPVEEVRKDKKQKVFNPGHKINKHVSKNVSLKDICLRLIHFINKGSKVSYEYIDELIIHLQRSILFLQKKKQELLKQKAGKK